MGRIGDEVVELRIRDNEPSLGRFHQHQKVEASKRCLNLADGPLPTRGRTGAVDDLRYEPTVSRDSVEGALGAGRQRDRLFANSGSDFASELASDPIERLSK